MPFNFFNNSKDKSYFSYFKYAFGEIILVAFGILIAVQVNNLNEVKKNKKVKYEFLENLTRVAYVWHEKRLEKERLEAEERAKEEEANKSEEKRNKNLTHCVSMVIYS